MNVKEIWENIKMTFAGNVNWQDDTWLLFCASDGKLYKQTL